MRSFLKSGWMIAVCFLIFFLSIYSNSFRVLTAEKEHYAENEFSLTLIYGKLLASENSGIFAHGGFPGYFYEKEWNDLRKAREYYFQEKKFKNYQYKPYTSQIGGQGILYSAFNQISPFSKKTNSEIFQITNAVLLSLALTLFVWWCFLNFGFLVSFITFLLTLLSPWLMMYGRDIWWVQWTFLLPFSVLLLYFRRRKNENLSNYYTLLFILIFLKLFMNGFEFITTFLIAVCIPFLLYHLKNLKKPKFLWQAAFYHAIVVFSAVALSLAVLFQQFKIWKGSYQAATDHLSDAFSRRSAGNYTYEHKSALVENLKALHLDVLYRYLGNNAMDFGFLQPFFSLKVPFGILIFLGVAASSFLYRYKNLRNLIIAGNLSFLAPASWLIIFREHGHVHTHVDFMIWYFPFLLFCFLFVALAINKLFGRNKISKFSF